MRFAIWYHFYNLKNVKNTHAGVLISVKVAGLKPATLLKLTLLHGCFSRFLNCTNGTKSRNAPHIDYLSIIIIIIFFIFLCLYFQISIFRSQSCHYWLTELFSHTALSIILERRVFKDMLLLIKCNTK